MVGFGTIIIWFAFVIVNSTRGHITPNHRLAVPLCGVVVRTARFFVSTAMEFPPETLASLLLVVSLLVIVIIVVCVPSLVAPAAVIPGAIFELVLLPSGGVLVRPAIVVPMVRVRVAVPEISIPGIVQIVATLIVRVIEEA
jgi:hypothetical protein